MSSSVQQTFLHYAVQHFLHKKRKSVYYLWSHIGVKQVDFNAKQAIRHLSEFDPESKWDEAEIDNEDGAEAHLRRYFDLVLKTLCQFAGAEHGYIAISGLRAGEFTPIVARGRELQSVPITLTSGTGNLVSKYLWKPDGIIIIDDPTNEPEYKGLVGIAQKILIRLEGHGELFGFVSLDRDVPLSEPDTLIRNLAEVMPAIAWRMAEQNFSMRLRHLSLPFAQIDPMQRPTLLYQQITDRIVQGFAADGVVLRIETDGNLETVSTAGNVDTSLIQPHLNNEGICGSVFISEEHTWATGETSSSGGMRVRGVAPKGGDMARLLSVGIKSYLVMRLQTEVDGHNHDRQGTLSFFYQRPHRFSWRDVALFRSYCNRVADTIALFNRTLDLQISHNNLERQQRHLTRIEIVALLVHDLLHKSLGVYQAIGDLTKYIDRLNKRGVSNQGLEVLKDQATQTHSLALNSYESLARIRSLQKGGADESQKQVTFTLAEAVANVEETLRPALVRNKIEMDKSIDSACVLFGPQQILEQVLFNLVINSVDAARTRTSRRPMSIHVHGQVERQGSVPRIVVRFWDDGPGINRQLFPEPNDVFVIGLTSKEDGTGTGLPVARSLLGRHFGGNLYLTDAAKALFTLVLPMRKRKE